MSLIIELVAQLRERGIRLKAHKAGVFCIRKTKLTPALRKQVARHRASLRKWASDAEFRRVQAESVCDRLRVKMRTIRGEASVLIRSSDYGPMARLALAILKLDKVPLIFTDGDQPPERYRRRRQRRDRARLRPSMPPIKPENPGGNFKPKTDETDDQPGADL